MLVIKIKLDDHMHASLTLLLTVMDQGTDLVKGNFLMYNIMTNNSIHDTSISCAPQFRTGYQKPHFLL